MSRQVRLYALSTCGWCKRTREFLNDHNIAFEDINVDLLEEEEKKRCRAELSQFNPRRSYPTVVVDEKDVIRGYDEDRLCEVLEL